MLRDFGFELRAVLVRTMMHRHFAVHKALKEWIDQVEHQQPRSLPCHFPESFSPTSPVDSLPEQHEESGVKWPEGNREQHEANHCPHQRDERSRSPCSKFVSPFARQPPLELRMLKSNDDLVSALDTWNTMMAKAAVQPRSDVVVTFVPRPSIVCESQLHQRIAAMGIDIYPKGSGPGQPPWGSGWPSWPILGEHCLHQSAVVEDHDPNAEGQGECGGQRQEIHVWDICGYDLTALLGGSCECGGRGQL